MVERYYFPACFGFRTFEEQGFLIFNHMDRFAQASSDLLQWVRDRKLIAREDVIEGLPNAPLALRRLFEGKNFGKQLVKIADPMPLDTLLALADRGR